jgi:selenide,water dikinase
VEKLLQSIANPALMKKIIVGAESKDDAAAYLVNNDVAILFTVDYGSPFCSDPFLFGEIAAANALSDIYAMGGRPISALSILTAPGTMPTDILIEISRGANEVCSSVGVPIVGGHSAESSELTFGLSVTGIRRPDYIVRNSSARRGDRIILSKPLGFGVYARAVAGGLDASFAKDAWLLGRQLNSVGAELAERRLVNAMTDVTGFGLLGHLFEMAQGAGVRASVKSSSIPTLPKAGALLQTVLSSGAGLRNRSSIKAWTRYERTVPAWIRHLISEPETNGGLLLSVDPSHVDSVLQMLRATGFANGTLIGEFTAGSTGIDVT